MILAGAAVALALRFLILVLLPSYFLI